MSSENRDKTKINKLKQYSNDNRQNTISQRKGIIQANSVSTKGIIKFINRSTILALVHPGEGPDLRTLLNVKE
jgi:hypothetical protein